MRKYLIFKKTRADSKAATLPEFLKSLDDLERSPPAIQDAFKAHDGQTLLKNTAMSSMAREPNAVALMMNLVSVAYRLIKSDPLRFNDTTEDGACLGVAAEDWTRAYSVVSFAHKRIDRSYGNPGAKVTIKPLLWGNPHAGEAARSIGNAGAGGGGKDDGDDQDGDRGGQTLDNGTIADAGMRVLADLRQGGKTYDEKRAEPKSRDEERAQRNRVYETLTTAVVTGAGYPRDKKGEAGRVNHAPPVSRRDGALWIQQMKKKLVIVPATDDAVTLEQLVERANSAGVGADVEGDLAVQDSIGAANANTIDAANNDVALAQLERDLIDGIGSEPKQDASADPVMTAATILTSETTVNLAGFVETMDALGWTDRLAGYYDTGKVLINPKGPGVCAEFGLTPGQIVGKFLFPFWGVSWLGPYRGPTGLGLGFFRIFWIFRRPRPLGPPLASGFG
jgi:hypothetical protein